MIECRAVIQPNRWQLRGITDKKHTAILPAVYKLKQIIEQVAGRKYGPFARHRMLYHRGFINNKQRMLMIIDLQFQIDQSIFVCTGEVDFSMDRIGLLFCITGQDLGGSAGWSQQHCFLTHLRKDIGKCLYNRGFTCAGISTEDEQGILLPPGDG